MYTSHSVVDACVVSSFSCTHHIASSTLVWCLLSHIHHTSHCPCLCGVSFPMYMAHSVIVACVVSPFQCRSHKASSTLVWFLLSNCTSNKASLMPVWCLLSHVHCT